MAENNNPKAIRLIAQHAKKTFNKNIETWRMAIARSSKEIYQNRHKI